MRYFFLSIVLIITGCSFVKRDKQTGYPQNLKLYYVSESQIADTEICKNVVSDFSYLFVRKDKKLVKEILDKCEWYVGVKRKKIDKQRVIYTVYTDSDLLIKAFDAYGILVKPHISFWIDGDDDIKRTIRGVENNRYAFYYDGFNTNIKRPSCDFNITFDYSVSVITTSVSLINSLMLEAKIFKKDNLVDSIKGIGTGEKEYALKSAVNEFVSKLRNIETELKKEYNVSIEFRNIIYSSDFKVIGSFLEKNFVGYYIENFLDRKVVIKLASDVSMEQITSQLVRSIDNVMVESIDVDNKRIIVMMNASMIRL